MNSEQDLDILMHSLRKQVTKIVSRLTELARISIFFC